MKSKLILALAALALVASTALGAERQRGFKYSSTNTWEYNLDDSTATPTPDTIAKVFNFNEVKNYGTVTGWFLVEYTNLDTTGAGAVADTAKDTVWVDWYTASESGTPSKLLSTTKVANIHVTASVAAGDYVPIVLSDSVLWDNVYARLRTQIWDSTAAKVAAGVGVTYKMTTELYAK